MKPDFPAPYFYLGNMAFNEKQFPQTIEYFTEYMKLAPAVPMVLNRIGLSYGHLGQPDKALGYFDQAIEAFPGNMPAYYNKALRCYQMGRMEDALRNIKKAQQLAPDNADIRVGDLLVTSGLGGRFPPGYPVAEVINVEQDPGRAFSQVTARPRALLDRSREVLAVWPPELEGPPAPTPAADQPGNGGT